MKRLFLGGIPIILLSTVMMPAAEAMEGKGTSPETLDNVTTVKLSGRIHEEFYEGLGNKLSGRHREEFFEGIGNKMVESHREEFFEGLLKG